MPKASKPIAQYTPHGSAAEHCAICKHFQPPVASARVAGPISPHGWSRFFAKKSSL